MKEFCLISLIFVSLTLHAGGIRYVEASSLNLIGRTFTDTSNPYHRVDTDRFPGFNPVETRQLHSPSGMAVLFRTDSRNIRVSADWGYVYEAHTSMAMSYRGFDLYILSKKGVWEYAGSVATKTIRQIRRPDDMLVIKDMDGTVHDCMLYFPIYSELLSCKIGVDEGAVIEPLASPFRHKVLFYGSSFTQGIGTSRAGMTYPIQWMRMSGLQVVSVATSGRCLMQPYMVPVLETSDADAFVFDTFSNPEAPLIRERLIPFIDRLVAAHPGKPLIFQRTIYRERRRYDKGLDQLESAKERVVDSLFAAIKGNPAYKDVYLITPSAADRHETSVDGTHPEDWGYTLWARSIAAPLKKILRRYGIK